MSRLVPLWLVLAASLTAGACAEQEPAAPAAAATPAADADADIAAINAARQAFMRAYETGDAEAIGRLYAEDAISEPNHQPTLEGRPAIVEGLRAMFEQVEVKPVLESDETRTLGNVGLDRGHYTVTVTPKAGAPPTTSQGRYLVIFRKEADGNWRVWRDIDNAGMPEMPADGESASDTDPAAKDSGR